MKLQYRLAHRVGRPVRRKRRPTAAVDKSLSFPGFHSITIHARRRYRETPIRLSRSFGEGWSCQILPSRIRPTLKPASSLLTH
jgi:hypothetical protein